MSYIAAINKAWDEIDKLYPGKKAVDLRFFSDEYNIDPAERRILSLSCNAPAKDFVSILLLHYLIAASKPLPESSGEWISFKELSGGESYYPAFRKRAIEPIIRKHGSDPKGIYDCLEKVSGKKLKQADAAIVVDAFAKVPILIEIWAGDDEFGPEANLLFDKSIQKIFCTEDIAVLAGFIGKYV
ncbi:MAG: DUF3786 domain-containing protein [Candidatus Omnitrophica bacterium]|jgi:hypothetical protein|nr:DUF3786 domain-containing protein [Candidatus Omnitrophota bacterium]